MDFSRVSANFALIAALVLGLFAVQAGADSGQGLGGTLGVSGLQYLPNPAMPGQYIDVYINVQNNKAQANAVQCELRPEYPFSIDSNEQAKKDIGTLSAGQNFVLKYKVRVDPAAILGDNNLKVACRTSDTDWVEAKMSISVQSQTKSVMIESITMNPLEIEPGSKGIMTVKIKNIASVPVRDVSIKLDLSGDNTPLAPIEGSTEKIFPVLDGNRELEVSFKLVSLADADAKAYKIPIRVSFKDYLGNSYTLNDTVGVILNSKPMIDAFVDSSKILRDNTGGTVIIKVVNRGLSEAKFLNVQAEDSDAVKVVEPKVFYVGNLKSDDFDTIEYKLFVTKAGSLASFSVTLTFRDANNNQYEQKIPIQIKLYSEQDITKFGLEQKQEFNWLPIIILLIIAGAVYWFKIRSKPKTA